MEDLSQKINQLLSSKEGMAQIQSMASALGLGGPPSSGNAMPDLTHAVEQLSQMGNGPSAPAELPAIDMNVILNIQRAMEAFSSGNKNVELLRSLRPHLSPQRQQKVDDAVRIMELVQMLPLLKESGLFGPGGVI